MGHATVEEVAGLVEQMGRGGMEHVCLNKTQVQLVAGGLDRLVAALERVQTPSQVDSDSDHWPLLELSQVRVARPLPPAPLPFALASLARGGGGA